MRGSSLRGHDDDRPRRLDLRRRGDAAGRLAGGRLLGFPLELTGVCVSLEDLFGSEGRALTERLRSLSDWDERFDVNEFGYADQSHLNGEFQQFAGTTPKISPIG